MMYSPFTLAELKICYEGLETRLNSWNGKSRCVEKIWKSSWLK